MKFCVPCQRFFKHKAAEDYQLCPFCGARFLPPEEQAAYLDARRVAQRRQYAQSFSLHRRDEQNLNYTEPDLQSLSVGGKRIMDSYKDYSGSR